MKGGRIINTKVCLGTVQLGLDYGIKNKDGKITKTNSFNLLDFAIDNNIKFFDTASAYGESEKVLGEYIYKRNIENSIKIISKTPPDIESKNNYDFIESSVLCSLENLKLNKLNGYLLHNPGHYYNNDIMNQIVNLKDENLVDNIGVSIYEESQAIDVASCKEIDYIQIPYNIFDFRLDNTDFFQLINKNDIKVFARSPFLQGLLLMKKDEVPERLYEAKKHLKELDNILEKFNLSRIEAALLFVYHNENIDFIVFGVDNKKQLKENISILSSKFKNIDNKELRDELRSEFSNINSKIINPSKW